MVYYPNTIVVDGVLPKDYLSDMEAAQTGRGTERAGRSSSEDRLPLASIVTGRMSSWLKLVIIVFKSSVFAGRYGIVNFVGWCFNLSKSKVSAGRYGIRSELRLS